jgi:LysM repeat protein
LSVDPLTKKYPWYTPYQFAGNKPIWAVDIDGLEESYSNTAFKAIFGSPSSYSHPNTALDIITNKRLQYQVTFANSPTGRFLGGVYNATAGVAGSIVSASYIAGSDGVGSALGGTIALQFSLGQASIGVAQMTNALFGSPNKVLDNSSNIPGLLAYGTNIPGASFIDAAGGLVPSILTSGGGKTLINLKGFVNNGFGIMTAFSDFKNTGKIAEAIVAFDQLKSVSGFAFESFNLASEVNGSKLFQKLEYTLSYTVKAGDNLTKIAKQLGTSVKNIANQNGIKDVDHIEKGQKVMYHNVIYGGGSSGGGGSNGVIK